MNGIQAGTYVGQQNAYSDRLGGDAPRDTIMFNAVRSMQANAELINQAVSRLEALKQRLFGQDAPTELSGKNQGGAVPAPNGVVYELANEFETAQRQANRLLTVLTDLERLA